MTGASMGVENQQLECVLSIQYPVQFKSHIIVQALLDTGSKVKAMTLAYAARLELRICFTNVGASKIEESMLLTYYMMLANF